MVKRRNHVPPEQYQRHSGGYRYITYEQVAEHHSHEESDRFARWMNHQTVGWTGDDKNLIGFRDAAAVYIEDYERWLQEGRLTHQLPGSWD